MVVPELPKGLEEQILEDIRNRDDISSANLPSAIFYTFVNTHQSLNCAGFSRTGAYVAGVKPSLQVKLHRMLPKRRMPHAVAVQTLVFNTAHQQAVPMSDTWPMLHDFSCQAMS